MKLGENKNENHSFKMEPWRARGGFGSSFPLQITVNTPRKSQIFDFSQETQEELTLGRKREMRVGREVREMGLPHPI
jgi:hypothetical protein